MRSKSSIGVLLGVMLNLVANHFTGVTSFRVESPSDETTQGAVTEDDPSTPIKRVPPEIVENPSDETTQGAVTEDDPSTPIKRVPSEIVENPSDETNQGAAQSGATTDDQLPWYQRNRPPPIQIPGKSQTETKDEDEPSTPISGGTPTDKPKVISGDTPKDKPKVISGGTPADKPKVISGDTPKDKPKVISGGTPADKPKVISGDTPKDKPKVISGGEPNDVPTVTNDNLPTGTKKSDNSPNGDMPTGTKKSENSPTVTNKPADLPTVTKASPTETQTNESGALRTCSVQVFSAQTLVFFFLLPSLVLHISGS